MRCVKLHSLSSTRTSNATLQDRKSRPPRLENTISNYQKSCTGTGARRLQHYFQSHEVIVKIDCPISKVLRKPELTGKMIAWSVEQSKFGIKYEPRRPIKSQCLTNFISELQDTPKVDKWWTLYVYRSSNTSRSGAEIVL